MTVLMKNPATPPQTKVLFPDGTTGTVDAAGNVQVPNNFVKDMLGAGFIIADQSNKLAWVAGRFYTSAAELLAAVLTVTGTLYAHPIFIPKPIVATSLNLSVTTGQTGGAARVGIYADNNGVPGALVYDGGAVVATGTAVVSPAGMAVTLQPGWYWLASIFTATTTFPSVAGIAVAAHSSSDQLLGSDTAAHSLDTVATNNSTGISKTGQTYGALPLVFPSAPSLIVAATCPALSIGV